MIKTLRGKHKWYGHRSHKAEAVGSNPTPRTNTGGNIMKQKMFENMVTHEQYLCPNTRDIRVIDNVEYLPVQKVNSPRIVLMRRDALKPVVINKKV